MELVNVMFASEPLGQTAGVAIGGMMGASGSISSSSSFSFGVPADDLTPFAREKHAFQQLLRAGRLSAFQGRYVAIHQGRVAGASSSQKELVRDFFHDRDKRSSVYIAFVGPRRVVRVRPFAVRRSS